MEKIYASLDPQESKKDYRFILTLACKLSIPPPIKVHSLRYLMFIFPLRLFLLTDLISIQWQRQIKEEVKKKLQGHL